MIIVNLLFNSNIDISPFLSIVSKDYLDYLNKNKIKDPRQIDIANFVGTSESNISKTYIKVFNEKIIKFKEENYDSNNL